MRRRGYRNLKKYRFKKRQIHKDSSRNGTLFADTQNTKPSQLDDSTIQKMNANLKLKSCVNCKEHKLKILDAALDRTLIICSWGCNTVYLLPKSLNIAQIEVI